MITKTMWKRITFLSVLLMILPGLSLAEVTLGKSRDQMIRLQTVDPIAENRVPTQSPPFSGKKASKALKKEEKGLKQDMVKQKDIVVQGN